MSDPLRVLNVHNHHAERGGAEVYFHSLTTLLRERGHHVATFERDNANVTSALAKFSAFASAIHSPSARREFADTLRRERINFVHLNNIWPLVSPSVIDASRAAGVPVVMSVHDYKLTCPAGQHLRDGRVCEKCIYAGREFWAAAHGCRNGRVWSSAYAVRNLVSRTRGVFDGVTLYLPTTRFVGDQLNRGGYGVGRTHVLPGFADLPNAADTEPAAGTYVGYVGRVSPEKGLPVLIEAARATGLPVKVAGEPSAMPELRRDLPPNVEFVGKLSRDALPGFYAGARFTVVPSVWLECFGLVCAEAQGHGRPVVASRIGGLPEVVEDGVTGLLFEPGNATELACVMRRLWDDPALLRRLGRAARERAGREYSRGVFYERLIAAYARAVAINQDREAA